MHATAKQNEINNNTVYIKCKATVIKSKKKVSYIYCTSETSYRVR